MPAPLVSIVLPTYNRGAFLADAIESVRAQSCADWELLISDDGSTDGSLSLVPNDPRIRVLTGAHSGNVAIVRNRALHVATGEFVGFVDSDDRWHSTKLDLQLARLRSEPSAGWCFGSYNLIDAAGQTIPLRAGVPTTDREGDLFPDFLLGRAGISLQTVLVRRALAAPTGCDERLAFGDDLDFMIRLARVAPGCSVPHVVADVRSHDGCGSRSRKDHMIHLAGAFWRYRRQTDDAHLQQACRQRAWRLAREYLAVARANGTLTSGLRKAVRVWLDS